MDDKRFRKFVIAYIINFSVIAVGVVLMILASNGVIPEIFQKISLIAVIASVILFGRFANSYRR